MGILGKIYKPYYEKYKNRISGFFTDEPQISRSGIPWSFVFEKEYAKRNSKNILEHLEGYSLRGIRKRDYPPAMFCQ